MENLKTAIRAIFTNKTRAFLTMLGVIIGVFSVVTLSAIGNGVTIYINNQFESLGANSLFVEPGKIDETDSSGMAGAMAAPNYLSTDLEKEILSFRQYVVSESPMQGISGNVSFRKKKITGLLLGINEHGLDLLGMKIAFGRDLSRSDAREKKAVVVLGSQVAKELFGSISPLGKKIKINERNFEVIGITAEKGGGMGVSYDDMIALPIEHIFDFSGSDTVQEFAIRIKSKDLIPAAKKDIQARLREVVKDGQVTVIDQAQVMETVDSIMGVLTAGLAGIAAISLIVGGIGIMNIMLVSVSERTREIGLRKALGATPNVILRQFLYEALFLSVTGGMIGVLMSLAVTLVIQNFFPATVSAGSVVLAFSVSLAVGLIFGVAPARRAARLSPIEALRYE